MNKAIIVQNGIRIERSFQAPAPLSALLPDFPQPCGGRGFCGNCRIRVQGKVSAPTAEERTRLSVDQLKDGVRLACQVTALGDVSVFIKTSQSLTKADAIVPQLRKPLGSSYGFAIDLGTTTLWAALYNLQNGECIASACAANPQRRMGADVLSRMDYAMQHGGIELSRLVRHALYDLCAQLLMQSCLAPNDVDAAVLVGNTAMLYLLLERNPRSIAMSPFQCDTLFGGFYPADFLPVCRGTKIYIPPCISAFLGTDAVAAAIVCGMDTSCSRMLADLGTNGEILLRCDDVLCGCSCAAGPAFEGVGLSCGMAAAEGAVCSVMLSGGQMLYDTIGKKPPTGISGSGYIDFIACLRKSGKLKKDGTLESDRIYLADTPLYITQQDIRTFQLAKSAVRTGMEYLLDAVPDKQAVELTIAGSFGTALRMQSAVQIGLIPTQIASHAHTAGNAAGTGAAMILLDESCIPRAHSIAAQTKTVQLTQEADFNDRLCHYLELA
ncbi:MAG: DUF4445 domain-containing protein [Clostridia bacterium]|nr:DUF4445 domain-containing protein [Clostridia bacterium]